MFTSQLVLSESEKYSTQVKYITSFSSLTIEQFSVPSVNHPIVTIDGEIYGFPHSQPALQIVEYSTKQRREGSVRFTRSNLHDFDTHVEDINWKQLEINKFRYYGPDGPTL